MVKRKKSLGHAFGDELAKVQDQLGHFKVREHNWTDTLLPNFQPESDHSVKKGNWIITFFTIATLVFFFAVFLRLFHLQIISGSENRELADSNRIQIKIIHAPRGVIFDRNGKILAANSPAFRLTNKQTGKAELISRDQALALEVANDARVKDLEIDNVRTYPMGETFAHVVGYMGQISPQQLKQTQYTNYLATDQIGQTGIEAEYEDLLRGIDGGEIIEVDSKGDKLRTLRTDPPIPGQNINLTIDADLQSRIYTLMKNTLLQVKSCCGAAVAIDPNNGEVLSLVSLPSFDPNIFNKNLNDATISEVLSRPDAPILNRVISGTYPPGSTFKIISSLAALDSGKITPDTTIVDNGFIYLGSFKFSNWYFNQYGRTEGPVNLVKAIQRSNDTYFYEIGRILGEDFLGSWAKKLKLGTKLDIDLPDEVTGIIPDQAWKEKVLQQVWFPGDTLHMAIGQGFVTSTPLQILGITSFVAADGVLYKPQLLLSHFKKTVLASHLLPADKIQIVKSGLELVPKTGGTAWPFFAFPIATAGKTGTAEYGDPKGKTHAWYTAFAPVDNPKIAMTVLIEGGGEGSSVAAPVVKETYRWFFSADKNKLIPDVYIQATDSGKTLGE